MLPRPHRLTRGEDFRRVTRGGARCGSSTLVVHLVPSRPAPAPARAGFVVSRAVGDAVTRNAVTRRLRHLVADRLTTLPPGTDLVVRALPASAGSSSVELAADLDRCLVKTMARSAGVGR